jgi:F0F1-type ATP synthase assembly protein I
MTADLKQKAKQIEQGLERFKTKDEPSDFKKDRKSGEAAFAEIVGGLIFGFVFGYFIDDYFNTAPWFLILFIILGLAGSVYNIYKATEK